MGSNTQFLKGVLTRFINIAKNKTSVGSDILALDPEIEEEKEVIQKIDNCIEKLQVYSEMVDC